MMAIDTHKAYRALIDGGFSEKQADTILKVVADQGDALVTKDDLKVTQSGIETAIAKVRSEMIVWQVGIAFALFGALRFLH
ncbi:MAG: hypothetical protein VB141_06205 [Burkholderia gladioli]